MLALIWKLVGFIPGLTSLMRWLGGVALQVYSAKLAADGSHEQKVADLAAKELDLAGQEDRLNAEAKRQIRGKWTEPEALAFYFVAFPYLLKSVTWDNVIGSFFAYDPRWLFFTRPVQGDTATMLVLIVTFWFGGRAVMSAGRHLISAWKGG
jgi:hypothetical protein